MVLGPLLCLALVVAVGCGDRVGLKADDGGTPDSGGSAGRTGGAGNPGSGTAGATGTAGTPGGAGKTGTAGVSGGAGVLGGAGTTASGQAGTSGTCGPVCEIFCPWGNVTDASGCPLCKCKPAPACQPNACGPAPFIPVPPMPCPGGGPESVTCARDAAGDCAWTASCAPLMCPTVACTTVCPYGYQLNAEGCSSCACNPSPSCTPQQCGPEPGVPSTMCSDGSVAGAACVVDSTGACGWTITKCPPPQCPAIACLRACPNGARPSANGCPTCDCLEPASCGTYGDYKSCLADTRCQWLQPGCGQPALATGGCFARTDVGCTSDASCVGGRQCLSRVINPCYNPLASGTCAACGATQMICL